MSVVVLGGGDIGRRIVGQLTAQGLPLSDIHAYVRSANSAEQCQQLGLSVERLDLDNLRQHLQQNLHACINAEIYYTVPPQKGGIADLRSRAVLSRWRDSGARPRKVVLISTTGVYGDCAGEWVTEQSPTEPKTERGKRRLDSEQAWLAWGQERGVPIVVLRVPGIYAYSRLPRQRLQRATPVVAPAECGYSNRIHADDLAQICIAAMKQGQGGDVFNATDGTPGKISEYLQAAAATLGLPALPEITMVEARDTLSAGMLSYLSESRKISNQKLLQSLNVHLRYPDFIEGMKYG